jgi:hypothetical protein
MDRAASKKPKAPVEALGGDFFYDELMTAQPDATGEFYRRRLMQKMPVNNRQAPDK